MEPGKQQFPGAAQLIGVLSRPIPPQREGSELGQPKMPYNLRPRPTSLILRAVKIPGPLTPEKNSIGALMEKFLPQGGVNAFSEEPVPKKGGG